MINLDVSSVGSVSFGGQGVDNAVTDPGEDIFSILMASVMAGAASGQFPAEFSISISAGAKGPETVSPGLNQNSVTRGLPFALRDQSSAVNGPPSQVSGQSPEFLGDIQSGLSSPALHHPHPNLFLEGEGIKEFSLPQGEDEGEGRVINNDAQDLEVARATIQDLQSAETDSHIKGVEDNEPVIKALGRDILVQGLIGDAGTKTQETQSRVSDLKEDREAMSGLPVKLKEDIAGDNQWKDDAVPGTGILDERKADGHESPPDTAEKNEHTPGENVRVTEFVMQNAEPNSKSPTDSTPAASVSQIRHQHHEPAEIVAQISGRMKAEFNGKGGEVRMTLNPESLGQVKIEVSVEGGVVKANIMAENASVKSSIESNLSLLKTSLEGHGLRVDHLSVEVDQRNENGFAKREDLQGWEQGMEERNPSSHERGGSSRQRWYRNHFREGNLNLFA